MGVSISNLSTGTSQIAVDGTTIFTSSGSAVSLPGNLGIGTSAPAAKLDVQNTGNVTVNIQTNTSGSPKLNLSAAGDDSASIYYGRGTGRLSIDISSVVGAVQLNSAGNLGLGVTPSAWQTGSNVFGLDIGPRAALSNSNTRTTLWNNGYRGTAATSFYKQNGAASMYDQDGGVHAWHTAPSGTAGNPITFTQAMTLDASGNLGVGTTSPTSILELKNAAPTITINGTTSNAARGLIFQSNGTQFARITSNFQTGEMRFLNGEAGQSGYYMTFFTDATERTRITQGGNLLVGTTVDSGYRIQATANSSVFRGVTSQATFSVPQIDLVDGGVETILTSSAASGLVEFGSFSNHGVAFKINRVEKARLNASGDFCIGKTSASEVVNSGTGYGFNNSSDPFFSIVNIAPSGINGCIYLNRRNTQTTNLLIAFLSNDGVNQTGVGSITHNGTSTNYSTMSDYRLKNNQQPLTNSGAFIDALKPKTWEWAANGSKGVGFIAHEVQEVSPGSVTGEKDAVDEEGKPVYQAMEYGSAEFIANIVAELQSLRKRSASLEAQNAALEQKNAQFEARLAALENK